MLSVSANVKIQLVACVCVHVVQIIRCEDKIYNADRHCGVLRALGPPISQLYNYVTNPPQYCDHIITYFQYCILRSPAPSGHFLL